MFLFIFYSNIVLFLLRPVVSQFLCININFLVAFSFLILMCPSSLIPHLPFEFLYGFSSGILILPMTTVPRIFITTFYSVMLTIGIFIKNLLCFSISTFTFFLSWFLRDSNIVFFSVMIFYNNCIFCLFVLTLMS